MLGYTLIYAVDWNGKPSSDEKERGWLAALQQPLPASTDPHEEIYSAYVGAAHPNEMHIVGRIWTDGGLAGPLTMRAR